MFKKLRNIGDCGIVCDFGDEVNQKINAGVIKLFHHVRNQVSKGNLKGKKAIIFCTYGSPRFAVATFFYNMPTRRLRRGIFRICGITDILYRRYFAVPFVTEEKRKKFLEDVKKTASNL